MFFNRSVRVKGEWIWDQLKLSNAAEAVRSGRLTTGSDPVDLAFIINLVDFSSGDGFDAPVLLIVRVDLFELVEVVLVMVVVTAVVRSVYVSHGRGRRW